MKFASTGKRAYVVRKLEVVLLKSYEYIFCFPRLSLPSLRYDGTL